MSRKEAEGEGGQQVRLLGGDSNLWCKKPATENRRPFGKATFLLLMFSLNPSFPRGV